MKCPDCGAENSEGNKFCRDCGVRMLAPMLFDTVSPPPQQSGDGESELGHEPTSAAVSYFSSPDGRKTIKTVAVISIVVLLIVGSLAYYYQPVRGIGSSSATTILEGQSVQFDFEPTQGIGPYTYLWSFGDGDTSSEKNPSHTYDRSGKFAVALVVTDRAGMKCYWDTMITVRLPLVFIDTISYPSSFSNPFGDTVLKLYIDGVQVSIGAALQPGTTHNVRLQILWVIDWGVMENTQTMEDETGIVIAPTTSTDLHCVLNYNPYGDTEFTLSTA